MNPVSPPAQARDRRRLHRSLRSPPRFSAATPFHGRLPAIRTCTSLFPEGPPKFVNGTASDRYDVVVSFLRRPGVKSVVVLKAPCWAGPRPSPAALWSPTTTTRVKPASPIRRKRRPASSRGPRTRTRGAPGRRTDYGDQMLRFVEAECGVASSPWTTPDYRRTCRRRGGVPQSGPSCSTQVELSALAASAPTAARVHHAGIRKRFCHWFRDASQPRPTNRRQGDLVSVLIA
jgi:hypothetical protein